MASFFDKIFGIDQIDKIKAPVIEFTKNNQLGEARNIASEGIDDGLEDIYRKKAISEIYKPQDFSLYGGNSARAIAGSAQNNQSDAGAVSQFSTNMSMADINAKQQGRQMVAGLEDERMAVGVENNRMATEVRNQKRVAKQQARAGIWSSLIQGGLSLASAYATGGASEVAKTGTEKPTFDPNNIPKLDFSGIKTPGVDSGPSKSFMNTFNSSTFRDIDPVNAEDVMKLKPAGSWFDKTLPMAAQTGENRDMYKMGVLDPEGYMAYSNMFGKVPQVPYR